MAFDTHAAMKALKRAHCVVKILEPWGIIFAAISLVIAFIAIAKDFEDRRIERIFRAWQVVEQFESRAANQTAGSGPLLRPALELLNRGDEPLEGISIPNATLVSATLRGANLENADLSGADLSGATLIAADLRGATLRGADLTSADLRDADLTLAILENADLTLADLRGADLTLADLRGATLIAADLRDADLPGADLRGATFRGANLTQANLQDANLQDARNLTPGQLDVVCGENGPANVPGDRIWQLERCVR